MNIPPGLGGGALLFWGWQTGYWIPAILGGVIFEAARVLPLRLRLGVAEFRRLWDFTTWLVVFAAAYLYLFRQTFGALLVFLQWLPMLYLPFVAAHLFSGEAPLERSVFFWPMRTRPAEAEEGIKTAYPYVGLCMLAASAANAQNRHFYAGACVLVGYGVMGLRPRPVALVLYGAVVWLGYLGHAWMDAVQNEVETRSARWLYGFVPREPDEHEGYTALGRIAEMKLSGRVLLEVEPELPAQPPRLIRQASFNRFFMGNWYSLRRAFLPVREDAGDTWVLLPGEPAPFSMSLATSFNGGRGMLPLPSGTVRVTGLNAQRLEQNRLGIVRVAGAPELGYYQVHFRPGLSLDGPPDSYDLEVPELEEPGIAGIAREIGVQQGQSPDKVMKLVQAFFRSHFEYRIEAKPAWAGLVRPNPGVTPLRQFLEESRTGHCELFASAAVLVLRRAGIPARYATGFLIPFEENPGRRVLVRERDAHSWVLCYVNGRWIDFDPTPPDFNSASNEWFYRFFSDTWHGMRFRYTVWQWTYQPGELLHYGLGIVVVLGAFGLWRLLKHRPWHEAIAGLSARRGAATRHGDDSEFYAVIARIEALHPRDSCESLRQWVRRVGESPDYASRRPLLEALLELHYQYRFDPQGLGAEGRAELRRCVEQWMSQETSHTAR